MQDGDLAANDIETPTIERYGDDNKGNMRYVLDKDDRPLEEPTPQGLDAYINAKVLLPVGGEMKSG